MGTKNKHFFQKFVGLSFMIFLMPSLLLNIINKTKIENTNHLKQTRVKARLELIKTTAKFHINEVVSDAQIIAKSQTISRFINSRRPYLDLIYVAKEFVTMSKEKGTYDQIRFLNTAGMEVVRVDYNNGDPAIFPSSKLQDKSNRYYFKDTLKLMPGQAYISPLDLNMEHGEIEIPYTPTIRIGVNVYQDSVNKGVVLVNYFGETILARIRNLFSATNSDSMMVNKDGFYLLARNNSDLWGFMFNNNNGLAETLPQVWNEINSREEGEINHGKHLYMFNTILVGSDNTKIAETGNYWKIIVKFKPVKMFSYDDPYLYQSLIVHALLLVAAVLLGWAITFYYSQKEYISNLAAINHIIFTKISTGIFITDKTNKIISANPGITEITGYTEEDLVGKDPSIFSSGHHDADFYKNMWEQLHNNKRWSGEIWNRTKSGSIIPESLSISIVEDKKQQVQYYIALTMDITRQKNVEAKLKRKAHYDQLTKLPNREYCKDVLNESVAKYRENFALLFIDLDKFKNVNDTQGHAAGDELLIEAASRLLLCTRDTDMVARLGGDEFVIMLQNIKSKPDAEIVAKNILKQIQKVFYIGGRENHISASIGITLFPSDAIGCEKLLKNADEAMYCAKQAGRNTYSFYRA